MHFFHCSARVLAVLLLLSHPKGASAECTPSLPVPQQCSGNGQRVRAAVSAESSEHDVSEAAFTCRCYDGFYGTDCERLDEQAAKLAGESDGYRVVRRTTIIHHRSPYVHPGVVPAVVPMPMVIPAPVAPAPVIVTTVVALRCYAHLVLPGRRSVSFQHGRLHPQWYLLGTDFHNVAHRCSRYHCHHLLLLCSGQLTDYHQRLSGIFEFQRLSAAILSGRG
ncbi:hypothetical protein FOZ62_012880, partial [Perkinsus olseni]